MEKKFLMFFHKKKKITLYDVLKKSKGPSLEDFKNISKMILQDNEKSVHEVQRESKTTIADRDKEISRLKHSQKFLVQINKLGNKKQGDQKLEEANQNLEKKFLKKK